jgi:hypothetical protein
MTQIVYKMHGSGAEDAVPTCHAGACCNQKFLNFQKPDWGGHSFSGFLPVATGA